MPLTEIGWQRVRNAHVGLTLQRMPPLTRPVDLEAVGQYWAYNHLMIPESERLTPIRGQVWRARFHAHTPWHYAQSPEDALFCLSQELSKGSE